MQKLRKNTEKNRFGNYWNRLWYLVCFVKIFVNMKW